MGKNKLREIMKIKRSEIDENIKEKMDGLIFNRIIQEKAFIQAKCIFIFVSFGDEVNTHKIISLALNLGKQVYVPKVISRAEGMIAIKINTLEELAPGKMGILEPAIEQAIVATVEELDLVILPGLAFDRKGGRIGYGGGFYDRFMKNIKPETMVLGICYDLQVVDKVPMENHDIKTNKIITEKAASFC